MKKITLGIVAVFLLLFSPLAVSAKSDNANSHSENSGSGKPVSPGKSLKVEPKGNSLKVTEVEVTEEGEEEELGEPTTETEVEVESEESEVEDNTTIKANENAALVIKNKLTAQTRFPLRVNTETNELIVITPKGAKVVTVLPDKAVENMLAANVIDYLGGKGGLLFDLENPEPTATSSGSPSPTATGSTEPSPTASGSAETAQAENFTLELDDDGELVYKIRGQKQKRFLGIFGVTIDKIVIVSAETGNVKSADTTSLLEAIQDFLSL